MWNFLKPTNWIQTRLYSSGNGACNDNVTLVINDVPDSLISVMDLMFVMSIGSMMALLNVVSMMTFTVMSTDILGVHVVELKRDFCNVYCVTATGENNFSNKEGRKLTIVPFLVLLEAGSVTIIPQNYTNIIIEITT